MEARSAPARAALDFEDEVDQRRVHDARRVGAPRDRRASDRRGHPARPSRDAPAPWRRATDGSLGVPAACTTRRRLARHPPAAALALEAEVRDGDARRPVLRLHEQDAVDRRVGDLLVRMPVDDEVDARRPRAPRAPRHSRSAPRARRCRSSPRRRARSASSRARRRRPPRALRARPREPRARCRACTTRPSGCRDPRPSSPGVVAPTMPTRTPPRSTIVQRGNARAAVGRMRVRGEEGKARLRAASLEERHAVVELVVADRRRVVLHRVHRRDHRMRRARGRDARGDVRERVALEQVARVHSTTRPGARRAASRRSWRRARARAAESARLAS